MKQKRSISRKNFLLITSAAASGVAFAVLRRVLAQGTEPEAFLPISMKEAIPNSATRTPTRTATRTPTRTATTTGTPGTPTETPSGTQVYTDGPDGDVNTACDVNLHAEAHAYNGGRHGAIQFGTYNYGLIRFDLSALPASAVISQAHLYLGLYDGGTGSANIYALLAANQGWIEGTGDLDPALAGEPCWDAKESDGGGGVQVAWAGGSHGCGVVGTDISSQPIGAFSSSGAPTVVEVELDIATVQGWVGPSNTNYGILIIPTTMNPYHIALSEYRTSSYRPKLVVHYTL